MSALHLFAVLFLVGVNAFFAAAEFSLVAVRVSRVRQLVEKGDARAKIVENLLSDMGRVVSGVQVGGFARGRDLLTRGNRVENDIFRRA